MSVKAANLWSKIGFLFGCAMALALLTADIDSYTTSGQASLPFGLHGQVIVFTVMITMGCTFAQIAIWRMRQQQAQFRALIVEVVAELARTADALEAKPHHEPAGGELRANGKVVEIGARLVKKIVEP